MYEISSLLIENYKSEAQWLTDCFWGDSHWTQKHMQIHFPFWNHFIGADAQNIHSLYFMSSFESLCADCWMCVSLMLESFASVSVSFDLITHTMQSTKSLPIKMFFLIQKTLFVNLLGKVTVDLSKETENR